MAYPWEAVIAEARGRPLVWLPMFPDHPAHLVDRIRRRRHRLLQRGDGRLEATIVNKYTSPGFPAHGDIWVRWVPALTTTTTNEGDWNGNGSVTDTGPDRGS